MALKNPYLISVYENTCKRNPGEPEFLQTVEEVFESLEPVVEKRPDFIKAGIFERMVEPERLISFRVSWVDDAGNVQVLADRTAPRIFLPLASCSRFIFLSS